MTLAEMESRFFEQKGKLAVGQLTEAEFKAELEKLRFQDAQGRWWMIGAQSGRWYYYENGRWLIGTPPQPGQPSPLPAQPESPKAEVKPTTPAATPSPVVTPPPQAAIASPATEKKEEPKKEEVKAESAPVEAKIVTSPPAAKATAPKPASPVAIERMRDTSESTSHYVKTPRTVLDPRLVIVGAAVLGLVVVMILLFVADQLVPNKPISSFLSRSLGGQTTATSTRATPTSGLGASVSNLIGVGDKLLNDGQIDPALAQYQAAAKLDPNSVDAQIHLANVYALVGRLSDANGAANTAVALEPNNPLAFAQLARALAWSGQNDAAISAAQKSIALDANNALAHAFLSEAYLRAGRYAEAQSEADAAVKADANSAEAHRAEAWWLVLNNKPEDGIGEWNRVTNLASTIFFYHFEFGEVYRVYLNDPAKAIPEYQRALQLYPAYVPAYISLGQAYLALNQPANAILQFQKAITYDPNSAEAYGYLGAGFKMQDKCSQAIPYFQKALTLNSKFAAAARGLSDCGVAGQAIPAATAQGTPQPVTIPTSIVPATVVPLPSVSPQANATPASAQPSAAAIPGKIAFSMYDGQYHLYLYTSAGGKKLLTELANVPILSLDGTQVLFQSWTSDQRGIHRIDSDGSADEQLSLRSEDTSPSWSPDGTQYVYATRAGPGADVSARSFTLRIDDPTVKAKQDPSVFIDKAQSPLWGPQNQIVYRDCGFPTDACGLALVNSDGSNKKGLTTINSVSPAWSPDGTKVAFMSDADRGNWDIWVVSANGGSPQRLTDDPNEDGLPAWSPDGKFIAFVSKRGGTWALWVMNADGTGQRKLIDLGGDPFGTIKGSGSGQPGQTWIEQRISWSK